MRRVKPRTEMLSTSPYIRIFTYFVFKPYKIYLPSCFNSLSLQPHTFIIHYLDPPQYFDSDGSSFKLNIPRECLWSYSTLPGCYHKLTFPEMRCRLSDNVIIARVIIIVHKNINNWQSYWLSDHDQPLKRAGYSNHLSCTMADCSEVNVDWRTDLNWLPARQ